MISLRLEKYNFGDYSRNNIFRCYQSAFDDKLYIDQQDLAELAKRHDFKSVVQETGPCIEKAIDFLFYRLHVVDPRLLPYNMQVIFLMTFFHKIQRPATMQLKVMEKWFWQTTYSNYFTIYSLANQRKSFRHFMNFLEGSEKDPLYVDGSVKQPFKTYSFPKKIYLSSVRSKAIVLFQLSYYCKKTRNVYGDKFMYQKIDNQRENTPENLIPYLSVGESDTETLNFENSVLRVAEECPFLVPAGEFAIKTEAGKSAFLNARLNLLQRTEAEFVKSLGLEYSAD